MHIESLSLQHFRNIQFARLGFSPSRHFLIGPNAQGKSNLLEAIGLMTALRSFRQQEASTWIEQGQKESRLIYHLHQESLGKCKLELILKNKTKQVFLNDTLCSKFSDFFGLFPTIVLSNQDLYLLRGAPALRRRFLDISLAAVDASYLKALRSYHAALAERNALLRSSKNPAALSAYEKIMAQAAPYLSLKRVEALAFLEKHMRVFYQKLSEREGDQLCLLCKNSIKKEAPSLKKEFLQSRTDYFKILSQQALSIDADAWQKLWVSQRDRDGLLKSTQEGPHRDDFEIYLQGNLAKDYASEGQQRSTVLALKLAQGRFFELESGVLPVVLIDDVLGELDPFRQECFWQALGSSHQVIASGTTIPPNETLWTFSQVQQGTFSPHFPS
jgi:DNA replication and repair protein RecF